MDNFDFKKYLAEGILLKEKHGIIPNLERYIELTDPSAELDDNEYDELILDDAQDEDKLNME